MRERIIAIMMSILALEYSLLAYTDSFQAVVKYPVIDMYYEKPHADMPISPESRQCCRGHQGLFNDLVTCIAEEGDYIKVTYDDIIYDLECDENYFWAFKNHFVAYDELSSSMKETIPDKQYAARPTLVLIYPWNNFSVGTRFVHLAEHDTSEAYGIIYYNYETDGLVIALVPHADALKEEIHEAINSQLHMVTLLNNLLDRVAASGQDNVIAYVWGGSSFLHPYQDTQFYLQNGAWERNEEKKPYNGYDCSELIMRFSKIAGLDFPWRTSTVMQQTRKLLSQDDILEEGDIIWIPGHVMLVNSLERNEILESRAYRSGYGRVHRIPLSEIFDGITTYQELIEHYHSNGLIRFKNRKGEPYPKATPFFLLKLLKNMTHRIQKMVGDGEEA